MRGRQYLSTRIGKCASSAKKCDQWGIKHNMSADGNLALLAERRDRIREWLAQEGEHTDFEQRHLDAGSPEQAYWHHGYQAALDDMLKLLNR